MLIPVTDPDDPRLLDYVGLRDAQLRRTDDSRFIAEGIKIIERSFTAGCLPRSFLLQEKWLPGLAGLLDSCPEVPVFVGSQRFIESVSGFHVHRGALGAFARPAQSPWKVIEQARRIIVCEEIVDHANLGAIIRVAAGLGWDGVVLSPGSADPLYRRAIKSSMGASLSLPWRRMETLQEIARLREAGFTLVASSLRAGSLNLADYTAGQKIALLLGTEGAGLSEEWLAVADVHVTIPMAPEVDSLNVAAAAAILAYQLR